MMWSFLAGVTAALFATSAGPLLAQSVLSVGPGGYSDIQSAVSAAAPGCVIEVQPGTYPGFLVQNKPLTIVATGPGVVVNVALQSGLGLHMAAGELRLEGIEFRNPGAFSPWVTMVVGGPVQGWPAGHVLFARCRIGVPLHSGFVTLHLRDCLVTERLTLRDGLMAVSSTFRPATMGMAISVDGGWLHASRCTFDSAIGSTGIHLRYPRGTWLVDCAVNGHALEPAVVGDTAYPLRSHRSVFQGGVQLASGSHVTGPLLGVDAPDRPSMGTIMPVSFRGEPGDLIGVVGGFGIGTPTWVTGLEQFVVGMTPSITLAFLIADGNGEATLPVSIPNDPGLRYLGLHLRGVDLTRLPLQLSPVVPLLVQ